MHNIKYIENFITYAKVVEQKSFTAAGQELGFSKSLVSKQITQLEHYLGVNLLNRTTRRLQVTEAGELFYQYCQRIVREATEAQQAVGPLQNEPQGLLRICAPESLSLSILPETISKFHHQYPKVRIDLNVSGRLLDLIEEGYDLALRIFRDHSLQDSSLKARRITPCQYISCASPTYLKKSKPIVTPHDLAEHNCMIYTESHSPHTWGFIDKEGSPYPVRVSGNLQANNAMILLHSVLEGNGIFLGPDIMFKQHLKSKKLVPVLADYCLPPGDLFAVYAYRQFVPLKLRVFIDFLISEWGTT